MSLYFDLYVIAYREALAIHKVYGGMGLSKHDIARQIFFDLMDRDRMEKVVQKRKEIIEMGTPPPPPVSFPKAPPKQSEEQNFSDAIEEIMSQPINIVKSDKIGVSTGSIMGRHGFK